MAPWDVRVLTPAKLAAFYRLVGGNYDPLFLDSPPSSVAFIYKSLGCFHSLQPDKDPFQSPSIPALTAQGFVRWQTVQLLLGPEEHVPYLQEAVKRLNLVNPDDQKLLPKVLPAECLPRTADQDMCKWHEGVTERLRLESESRANANPPPQRPRGAEAETAGNVSNRNRPMSDATEYPHASPTHPSFAHSIGAPGVVPSIRTKFRNLNFSSVYSPHTMPQDLADSTSPTSDRTGSLPDRLKPQAFRHVPGRHSKSNISATSSSSPSSRSRSPSPRPRSRHHSRNRTSSPPPRPSRSSSAHRRPPSPSRLARPTEHNQRRHSAQGPYRDRDAANHRARTGSHVSPRSSHGLSPPFYYQQQNPPSQPTSQGTPSPGATAPPPAQPPQPQPSPLAPLQQVRSAPIPQGAFPRSGYRYSVAGYGPSPTVAGVAAGSGANWRERGPPSAERDAKRSTSGSRRSADAAPRFADEDLPRRDEGRRRQSQYTGDAAWEKGGSNVGRRRSRERADSSGRR